MQNSERSFEKQIGELRIGCMLIDQEIVIGVRNGQVELQCRFSDELMNSQLKDIFNDVNVFYICFSMICQEWTLENNYVLLDSDNVLEIMYTLKVMKVEIKKKVFLKTLPKQHKAITKEQTPQVQHGNVQELISTAKSMSDFKNILQFLHNQRKEDNKCLQKLLLENEGLKNVLKAFQMEIYHLNIKNNQITKNLNEVAQLSNRHFEILQSYVKQKNVKSEQKYLKEFNALEKDVKSHRNLIDSLRNESKQDIKKVQEDIGLLQNKIHIPPTKILFVPNTKSPFFNRFKVQENGLKLTISKKTQLVGDKPFPGMGVYYFNVRNVSILNNQINVGVISQSKAFEQFSNFDLKCINYFGGSGCINNKGSDKLIGRQFQRKQVMTVVVDMNEGIVRWLINNREICSAQMRQLRKDILIPYIQLMNKESKIQFGT